tara:strand:- start:24 stop:179 length:156 start_codon:yes stop_codon:yes gene_type:complete
METVKQEIENTIKAYEKQIDKTFKTMPKQTYVWFTAKISAYKDVLQQIEKK